MSLPHKPTNDLKGATQLTQDAIIGIVNLIESLHHTILKLGKVDPNPDTHRTKGITGFVYKSIKIGAELAGIGIGALLDKIADKIGESHSSKEREAIVSALNGVLGDYLAERNNPLAIKMSFRKNGKSVNIEDLDEDLIRTQGRLLVFIHGLCMNDLQWERKGFDYSNSTSSELNVATIHLHYNTGKHISENGLEFAQQVEDLCLRLTNLKNVNFVTHSMGGLVLRSTLHQAHSRGKSWPSIVKKVIFLGTPHNGALLERAGNGFELLMENTPYTRPFTKLGHIRSSGITDLRYAYLSAEDWANTNVHKEKGDFGKFIPLPEEIAFYALAATSGQKSTKLSDEIMGDGLVTMSSAFGEDSNGRTLTIPKPNKLLVRGISHFDILSNEEVYQKLIEWLNPD